MLAVVQDILKVRPRMVMLAVTALMRLETQHIPNMVLAVAVGFMEPVVDFLERLRNMTNMDEGASSAVIKSVGIALVAEIAAVLCTDSGNGSMGKTVQLLGSAVILWLSLPVMEELLDLIQRVLEGL